MWLLLSRFGRSQSYVHTRHDTKRGRRCCHRRVYQMCSDARVYRPAFWDADFTPTLVYSVVFYDKRACTHLCARETSQTCCEFIGQWWQLQTNACANRISSIKHKFLIFVTRKKEKSAILKSMFWRDSQKLFQLKYSLSVTIGGIQHRSARSH